MSEYRPYCHPVQQWNLRPAIIVGTFEALLRVVWVLIASRQPIGLSDPLIYLRSGAAIAAGDGYTSLLGHPTAYYPPGYPFFLGGVQWFLQLVGLGYHRVLVVGLLQALLGGVAAGALVVAGDQMLARSHRSDGAAVNRHRWSIGVIAGLIFAVWPNLILHAPLILGESLLLALFSVLLAALVTSTSRSTASSGTARSEHSSHLSTIIVVCTIGCAWVRPQSIFLLVPAVVVA